MNGRRMPPLWGLPVRLASALSVNAYVRAAYRIRRFGELPLPGGPALFVSNHQIDPDLMAVIAEIGLRSGWRRPFFTASARLLHEPGFFAVRIPWLAPLFHGVNLSRLFMGMGLLPIENELRTRSLSRWAFSVERLHGVLPLERVFTAAAVERHGLAGLTTADLFRYRNFAVARQSAKLSELLPEHRREQLALTARFVEEDLSRIESFIRQGAAFYVTPEGEYSRDGAMLPFRGIWDRLAPLAEHVFLAGISYDPFVGRRLSQLYRVVPLRDRRNVVNELKAARPVTTSAMLCSWLAQAPRVFSAADAVRGVAALRAGLPPNAFVDPDYDRGASRLVEEALQRMVRLGILANGGRSYHLTERRRHPQFSEVADVLAFQHRFLSETIAACAGRRAITGEIELHESPRSRASIAR